MSTAPLPEELVELEHRLRGRREDDLATRSRGQIMEAVSLELAAGRRPWHRGINLWRYAAASAAIFIIGANLSMTAASVTRFVNPPRVAAIDVGRLAKALRKSVPELSAQEADRLAAMTAAEQDIPHVPLVRASTASIKQGVIP